MFFSTFYELGSWLHDSHNLTHSVPPKDPLLLFSQVTPLTQARGENKATHIWTQALNGVDSWSFIIFFQNKHMLCLHYVGWCLDSPWACLRRCVSTQVMNDSVVGKRVAARSSRGTQCLHYTISSVGTQCLHYTISSAGTQCLHYTISSRGTQCLHYTISSGVHSAFITLSVPSLHH